VRTHTPSLLSLGIPDPSLGHKDFTDWAIVKAEISENAESRESGQVTHWYEPDVYPAEPIFVPDPAGTREDDGVLLFNAYHAGKSCEERRRGGWGLEGFI
jgi:hypothetical protein